MLYCVYMYLVGREIDPDVCFNRFLKLSPRLQKTITENVRCAFVFSNEKHVSIVSQKLKESSAGLEN